MAGMLVPVILALAALSPPAVAAPEATADGASSAERRRATLLAVDAWMDAVVLVQLGSTTCAGAVIDPAGTVATAYHCVAPGGRPRLVTREGRRVVGRVTRVDRARDLAIIEAPELAGTAWLEPVDRAPALGTPVVALGHPAGADLPAGFYTGTLRFSASQGIVAAIGPEAVQITAPVNPGNSGGPVVDDRGRLVGVVSRRLAGQSLGFAGRAAHLRALIARSDDGVGVVGGTIALEGALTALDLGTITLGPKLEVGFRDRVVVEGSVSFPMSPRWTAARFGEARFLRGEVHGGLRQRLGHGSWTTRVDAWAGVAQQETVSSTPGDPLRLTTEVAFVPTVGGTVRMRNIGFEMGFGLDPAGTAPMSRVGLVLRVPGVFTVF